MFESVLIPARVEMDVYKESLMDESTLERLLGILRNSDLECLRFADRLQEIGDELTIKTVSAWIDMSLTQPRMLHNMASMHKGVIDIMVFFNSKKGFEVLAEVLANTHKFDGKMFRLLSY